MSSNNLALYNALPAEEKELWRALGLEERDIYASLPASRSEGGNAHHIAHANRQDFLRLDPATRDWRWIGWAA